MCLGLMFNFILERGIWGRGGTPACQPLAYTLLANFTCVCGGGGSPPPPLSFLINKGENFQQDVERLGLNKTQYCTCRR